MYAFCILIFAIFPVLHQSPPDTIYNSGSLMNIASFHIASFTMAQAVLKQLLINTANFIFFFFSFFGYDTLIIEPAIDYTFQELIIMKLAGHTPLPPLSFITTCALPQPLAPYIIAEGPLGKPDPPVVDRRQNISFLCRR